MRPTRSRIWGWVAIAVCASLAMTAVGIDSSCHLKTIFDRGVIVWQASLFLAWIAVPTILFLAVPIFVVGIILTNLGGRFRAFQLFWSENILVWFVIGAFVVLGSTLIVYEHQLRVAPLPCAI